MTDLAETERAARIEHERWEGMTFNEYQRISMATASKEVDDEPQLALLNIALGLSGESGEFADMVKKHIFHGHEFDHDKAAKELGDILWYIQWGAHQLGLSMNDIAQINVDKLQRRYPQGFSAADSIVRRDTLPYSGDINREGYVTEEEYANDGQSA